MPQKISLEEFRRNSKPSDVHNCKACLFDSEPVLPTIIAPHSESTEERFYNEAIKADYFFDEASEIEYNKECVWCLQEFDSQTKEGFNHKLRCREAGCPFNESEFGCSAGKLVCKAQDSYFLKPAPNGLRLDCSACGCYMRIRHDPDGYGDVQAECLCGNNVTTIL
jgi:hypothetical protein